MSNQPPKDSHAIPMTHGANQAVASESHRQEIDIANLKKEVDALQIALMGQKKPWYTNVSTLISGIALAFSFGTTFVSYQRMQSQDIQNTRIELRGLLQRLSSLPKENIEITQKYKDDPGATAAVSSFLNQENALLARQAAEILSKLPKEYVSATEYYAVGVALQASYNIEGAKEEFTKAIETALDLNDKVAALRTRAGLYYAMGQPGAGRIDYQRALNIFSEFEGIPYGGYTQKSTHIRTELAWAYSESGIGEKNIALEHIIKAEKMALSLASLPGGVQLVNQVKQARTLLMADSDNQPFPVQPVPDIQYQRAPPRITEQ